MSASSTKQLNPTNKGTDTMRILTTAAIVSAVALTGCEVTEAGKASREAYYSDKPAAVTCYAYGTLTFEGTSTGKIIYDEGGRLTFVDAANGRLTTIEGECRVVYAR
jgi:hypothetical protein